MMSQDGISIYDRYNIPYYMMLPVSLLLGAVGYVYTIFTSTKIVLNVALWVAHALGLPADIVML
jgi:hypothetical protein